VFSSGGFVTSRIWAIPKPAAGSTTCTPPTSAPFFPPAPPLTTADGDTAFTPVPANTFAPSAMGYVVAADFAADSEIMVWHVSGPAATPVLTPVGEVAVSAYDFPANIPQPSSAEVLDSLDTRLTNAVAVPDADAGGAMGIWTQHTVDPDAPGGPSVVRWYEIIPGMATPRQEGTISDPTHYVFNGAITPAAAGNHATINYNVGSSTLMVEIRALSRSGASPLGSMGGEITLGASSDITEDFSCDLAPLFACRWGDYAGASPDPVFRYLTWGSNQLLGTQTAMEAAWTTRNFALADTALVPLTVTKAGAGSGTVTSATPDIACGLMCEQLLPLGTTETLTATPDPGSYFKGWSGGGCVSTGPCALTVSAATAVTATFETQSKRKVAIRAKPKNASPGDKVLVILKDKSPAGFLAVCEHVGDKVKFQRKTKGGWKAFAKKKLKGTCKAKVRTVVQVPTKFRAILPMQDADHLKTRSKVARVKVA